MKFKSHNIITPLKFPQKETPPQAKIANPPQFEGGPGVTLCKAVILFFQNLRKSLFLAKIWVFNEKS